MSIPSDTRTSLDQLSTPGSSPLIPFRAARSPFGDRCRHFNSVTRAACCPLPKESATSRTLGVPRLRSVLARSTIAVLNPWSFRQHSADGTATLTISYLVASRSHTVIHRLHRWGWRRMNAASQTAFRLSLLREPNAHTGADRFNVRATSRTMCCSNCQRSVCAYFQRKWAGRRSNPRLRCFKPPLDHLSYQPMLGCSGFARFGHEKRLDACVTPSLHKKAIRLKSECHMSNRYAGELPG